MLRRLPASVLLVSASTLGLDFENKSGAFKMTLCSMALGAGRGSALEGRAARRAAAVQRSRVESAAV